MPSASYSRRSFLAQSAAALAMPFLPWQQKAKPQKILVIGAGISGLACARTLNKLGYDVTVFEARSRIGGRLFTDQSFGFPVEMGSAWTLAGGEAATDVAQQQIPLIIDAMDWLIQNEEGKAVPQANVSQLTAQANRAIAAANQEGLKLGSKATVRTALMSLSHPILLDPSGKFALEVASEAVVGSGIDDLAAWWNPIHINGKRATPTGGWANYCDKMAAGLDIRFQETVQNIVFDKNGVQVDLDGSTVSGDKVVICVPLPVLQSRDFVITGAVPDSWTQAITKIGVGQLERVILEFDKIRWPRQTRLADVSTAGSPCMYFEPLPGDKDHAILVGVVTGNAQMGDDMGIQATQQLRGILGTDLPDPVRVKVSRWANDPYALGGTTYPTADTNSEIISAAHQPFGRRIFFAGDFTDAASIGTVHGAFMSGIKAAGQVSQD